MQHRTLGLALAALAMTVAPAQAEDSSSADRKALSLTVYNDNLGLVREVRTLRLAAGTRTLEFADVAAGIDPTSVALRSLDASPSLRVLEQNFAFDLLTPQKLKEKYVGQEVEIQTDSGPVRATLLSTNEGEVYRIGDRIHLQAPGKVILPRVPENLVARPTLTWLVQSDRAGEQQAEASYLTSGLSWQATYVLVLAPDQKRSTLNGWVTLSNQSGTSYENAQLTLVAGDVHRARPKGHPRAEQLRAMAADAAESPFEERGLFEYHSYKLGRSTTLRDRQSKQLSLMGAAGIPTRKTYRFEAPGYPIWLQNAERQQKKVGVTLELTNSKQDRLGMPLPRGVIRVYQQDQDRQLQMVGEDSLDHTPVNEPFSIQVGEAFDLVGERAQTHYRMLGERMSEAGYEVVLRNHKDQGVTIEVAESLGGDWQIVSSSLPYTKRNAQRVTFAVPVAAHGTTKLQYVVRTRY